MVTSLSHSAEGDGARDRALPLPDPAAALPLCRPFASDPGWREAWWWLGIPATLAIFLFVVHTLAPDFYLAYILPEGYGFLELGHFFIPLAGLLISVRLLFKPIVRARPLMLAVAGLGALACLYIAGEEMSWGQHFFQWNTPDYWTEVNRQQETNLHNTMNVFDKTPRALLEVGVWVGGLAVPLLALYLPSVRRNRFAIFLPADAMAPTALGALLFKTISTLNQEFGIVSIARPSEATESYLYLFILFYLVVFARRIGELESQAV